MTRRPLAAAALVVAGCGGGSTITTTVTQPAPAGTGRAPALVVRSKNSVAAFVPVTVKGRQYVFQVDSGAAQPVIDSGVAKRLGLEAAGPAETKTTIGCRTSSQPVRIADWKLGGATLPAITVAAAKTELPGKTRGKVIGLLGADVFDRFGRLTLDFRGRSLTLGGPAPAGGTSVPVRVARAQGETFVFASARIHGRAAGFLVDTGAGTSMIDSRAAHKLGLRAAGAAKTITAVSCPTRVQPVRLDRWSVGGVSLPTALAASSKSNITDQTNGQVVGLIGSDVLAHYGTVSIDFRAQRLTLGGQRPTVSRPR